MNVFRFPSGFLALAIAVSGWGGEISSVRIGPFVDEVPANHLKFYLHFSVPMERGDAFRHLRLIEIDEDGKEVTEVPEPFREVELWDETFTRMTVWLHPGRQKPGVNLNVEIGPILEEGKSYRLAISEGWKTESGEMLEGDRKKDFEAGRVDEEQPDPSTWGSGYGVDASGRPLVLVHTGESLDPQSARSRIEILVGGEAVDFEVRANQLVFPQPPEKIESFRIRIDPRLEDLAGNSLARPFNLDLESNPEFEERTEPVELVFPRKVVVPEKPSFP